MFLYISVSLSKWRIRGGSSPNQRGRGGGAISGGTCALSLVTGLCDSRVRNDGTACGLFHLATESAGMFRVYS